VRVQAVYVHSLRVLQLQSRCHRVQTWHNQHDRACLNADQINALNNIYRESWATTPCELVEPYPRPRVVPEGKGCYG
jgi:REP element-mobilizing transposase RayT